MLHQKQSRYVKKIKYIYMYIYIYIYIAIMQLELEAIVIQSMVLRELVWFSVSLFTISLKGVCVSQ